jgi:hypothetical protein
MTLGQVALKPIDAAKLVNDYYASDVLIVGEGWFVWKVTRVPSDISKARSRSIPPAKWRHRRVFRPLSVRSRRDT